MPILIDPEENESHAILNLPIAWTDSSVLEIGSGDGRLTWRFADKVAHVIAIEPDNEKHKTALADRPIGFEYVEFLNLGLDVFVKQNKEKFDLAILSWSL
jgi:tRNA A58 N-methylase Trm61